MARKAVVKTKQCKFCHTPIGRGLSLCKACANPEPGKCRCSSCLTAKDVEPHFRMYKQGANSVPMSVCRECERAHERLRNASRPDRKRRPEKPVVEEDQVVFICPTHKAKRKAKRTPKDPSYIKPFVHEHRRVATCACGNPVYNVSQLVLDAGISVKCPACVANLGVDREVFIRAMAAVAVHRHKRGRKPSTAAEFDEVEVAA